MLTFLTALQIDAYMDHVDRHFRGRPHPCIPCKQLGQCPLLFARYRCRRRACVRTSPAAGALVGVSTSWRRPGIALCRQLRESCCSSTSSSSTPVACTTGRCRSLEVAPAHRPGDPSGDAGGEVWCSRACPYGPGASACLPSGADRSDFRPAAQFLTRFWGVAPRWTVRRLYGFVAASAAGLPRWSSGGSAFVFVSPPSGLVRGDSSRGSLLSGGGDHFGT